LNYIASGTYAVTVTDASGCPAAASFNVTEPAAIVVNGVVTNVSCFGGNDGAINLTVSGGTTPYLFAWSNGASTTNLNYIASGTYAVTVTDASGCPATASFNVTEPAAIVVNGVVTNVSCFGGSDGAINLTVSGGTSPYSFMWGTGAAAQSINGLLAGTYTVIVTDANGCPTTASYIVVQPNAIQLSAVITNVFCHGGSTGAIDLTVTGGTPPYLYLWSNGATTQDLAGLPAGTYSVTVTDANGCAAITVVKSTPFIVTQPPPLNIYFELIDVSIPEGTDGAIDVTASGGTPGYAYNWSTGATSEDVSGLPAGFYDLTVSDSNGCTLIETVEIAEPAGLDVQSINLAAGWSIMSTYIDPVAPQVDSVFASVVTSISIIKNTTGHVFWPAFNLNMIGNLIIGQGYQVKMNVNESLDIVGTAVIPELTPVMLQTGWNIIGYLRQSPGDAVSMLTSIVNELTVLKNGDGQVYWPAFNLNMIGNLLPGSGYLCCLSASTTLTYPSNSVMSKTDFVPHEPVNYHRVKSTGSNMTLGIPTFAWDKMPLQGDEIAIFTIGGELVGSTVYSDDHLAIPIWGDDETTGDVDGLLSGEGYEIRIWESETGDKRSLIVQDWLEGDGLFETNKIAIASVVSVEEIRYFWLNQNIPNPFSQETQFNFYLPRASHVEFSILDMLGKTIEIIISEDMEAGEHSKRFQSNNLLPGVYYYKLETPNYYETRKMVIVK
jgi:hypothetical protein